MSAALEDRLADYGVDAVSSAARLEAFHRVENTYLATFQTLGGLGLILGTVGLGAVLLRNVLERRRELALMRAVGYNARHLSLMVLAEKRAAPVRRAGRGHRLRHRRDCTGVARAGRRRPAVVARRVAGGGDSHRFRGVAGGNDRGGPLAAARRIAREVAVGPFSGHPLYVPACPPVPSVATRRKLMTAAAAGARHVVLLGMM